MVKNQCNNDEEGGHTPAVQFKDKLPPPPTTSPVKQHQTQDEKDAQVLLTIQSELYNMGKALTCPLCLSTLRTPVFLPCLHAFCQSCITTSLSLHSGNKCPICKVKFSKRSMVHSEHLEDLVKGYKLSLRAFGFAPIVFGEEIGLTQIEEDVTFSIEDKDHDDDHNDGDESKGDRLLFPDGDGPDSNLSVTDLSTTRSNSKRSRVSEDDANTKLKRSKLRQTSSGKIIPKEKNNSKVTLAKAAPPSLRQCHEHLEVSRAIHKVLKNAVSSSATNTAHDDNASLPPPTTRRSTRSKDTTAKQSHSNNTSSLAAMTAEQREKELQLRRLNNLLIEQEKVIAVDERALVRAAVSRHRKRSLDNIAVTNNLGNGIREGESEEESHDVKNVIEKDKNTTEPEQDVSELTLNSTTYTAENIRNTSTDSVLDESSLVVNDGNTVRKLSDNVDKTGISSVGLDDSSIILNDGNTVKRSKSSDEKTKLNTSSSTALDESSILINDGNTVKRSKSNDEKTNFNTTSSTLLDESSIVINDGNTVKRSRGSCNNNINATLTSSMELNESSIVINDDNTVKKFRDSKNENKKRTGTASITEKDQEEEAIGHDQTFFTADDDQVDLGTKTEPQKLLSAQKKGPEKQQQEQLKPLLVTSQEMYETSMDEAREKEAADRSGEWMLEEETKNDFNTIHAEGSTEENTKKTIDDKKRSTGHNDTEVEAGKEKFFSASSQLPEVGTDPTKDTERTAYKLPTSVISLKTIVRVQSRTWPGVNKPGGVARIIKVHTDSDAGIKYDVAYVLGGKEKFVDSAFVSLHEEEQNKFVSPTKIDDPEVAKDGAGNRRSGRQSRRVGNTSNEKENQIPHDLLAALSREDRKTKTSSTKKDEKKSKDGGSNSALSGKKRGLLEKNDKKQKRLKKISAKADNFSSKKKAEFPTVEIYKDPIDTNPGADKSISDSADLAISPTECHLSLRDILELSKDRYHKMLIGASEEISTTSKKQVITIVTSSLNEYDQNLVVVFCSEMRGKGVNVKIGKDIHPKKTTVCITPSSPNKSDARVKESKCRTLKAMRAALAGIPLLTPEWISSCLRQQKILAPTECMCIRTLPTKVVELMSNATLPNIDDVKKSPSAVYGVTTLAALNEKINNQSATSSHKLLGNASVLLCGQWKNVPGAPKKNDIQLLLREAGSTILTSAGQAVKILKDVASNSKTYSGILILLCDDMADKNGGISDNLHRASQNTITQISGVKKSNLPGRLLVVNTNWLFDCISCATVLGVEHYEPASSRAKCLWKALLKK